MRRCETVDGVQVDPAAAVMASLVGHVRRVVIERGRGGHRAGPQESRLFTGSAREAAKLQGASMFLARLRATSNAHRPHRRVGCSTASPTRPTPDPAAPATTSTRTRGYTVWRDDERPLAHPPTRRHRDRPPPDVDVNVARDPPVVTPARSGAGGARR